MTRRLIFAALMAALAASDSLKATERYVRTSADLQAALDAAQPGDTILLEPGATFLGNFVLPVKTGGTFITVRSATPDVVLPGSGTRIDPSHAQLLPRIQSPNNAAALKTAPGAHHWRLQYLEFGPNQGGIGDLIQIGSGAIAQDTLPEVPFALELDHLYVHGDRLLGQKRCIALNAAAVTIRDSHISDCKAIGMDAQAIGGWNGPGPYLIENNYIEGAGENFLLGGADPAIPGLIATDVTFRRNYVSRPLSWRDPILATPAAVSAGPIAGGSLPAGAYAYRIVARRPAGQGGTARSAASAEATASLSGTGAVQIDWAAVPDATEYLVYGRSPGAQTTYWKTTATSFVDTGAAGTAGAVPTSAGTRWQVKNLFELKNARRVLIEGNTFENNWKDAQVGYAILFTPRNSYGNCPWCTVEDVEFRYNIVRHVAGGISILGIDRDRPLPSAQARNIRIRHNLFYDVSDVRWGGQGWGLMIGDEPRDVLVDHNTIDHTGTAVVYAYGGTSANPLEILGVQFTNNLTRHNAYGINGAGQSYGNGAIAAFFPDGVVTANLLAGGNPSRYPPGNYFGADFDAQFVDPARGDYRLVDGSPYRVQSTDGPAMGADLDALLPRQPVPPSLVTGPCAPGNLRVTVGQ